MAPTWWASSPPRGLGGCGAARPTKGARGRGLLTVEERRVSAGRNAPNVVRIVSREWLAWLRLRAPKKRALGGGRKLVHPTPTQEKNKATSAQRNRAWAAGGQGPGGRRNNLSGSGSWMRSTHRSDTA